MIVLLFIAVLIWFWWSTAHKIKKEFLEKKPDDMPYYTKVIPAGDNTKRLLKLDKKHYVKYIARNDKKEVCFPQSGIGNKRFYILNITFNPHVSESITSKGHTGSALAGGLLAGGVGAAIGASRARTSKVETTEHLSNAYLTLADTELTKTYNMSLLMKTDKFNELTAEYMLNDIELANLQKKLGQADEEVNTVNNDKEDIETRLTRLKSLLDKKLINDQEYEDKKKQILNL